MGWYKLLKKITADVIPSPAPKVFGPSCPQCGAKTVKRRGPYGEFYGCERYPKCKGTIAINKPTPQNAPFKPQQTQQPKPSPTPQPLAPKKTWVLATRLADGLPVVMSKGQGGWEFMSEGGETGIIPEASLSTNVKSVLDEQGNKITGQDPKALFSLFRKMNGIEEPKTEEPKPEPNQQIPGRIPAERISANQKAVEDSFLKTDKSVMINALAGSGKAQPLTAKLLTPNGYIKMGDIKLGDKVYGSDGLPHRVEGVFPQGNKEVFEVKFSDGTTTRCCKDHLWTVETKANRDLSRHHKQPLFSRSEVKSLESISEDLLYKNYPKYYIPLVSQIIFPQKKTKIDPYIMGVLLGDGSFRTGCVSFSSADAEIVQSVNASLPERLTSRPTGSGCDYRISGRIKGIRNPIVTEIKKLGLWKSTSNTKFIPNEYKINDINTRISILQGLLDTDGYCTKNQIEYSTTSICLAEDVIFIVQSLGGIAKISSRQTSYTYKNIKKKGKISYRVMIKLPSSIMPFRLKRKLESYAPSIKYHAKRSIISVNKIGEEECQCISIESPDSLYVTDNCILTHNTTMLRHLSSFKQPNEKWLYLVFNKKNQIEASTGKGRFPNGVEVMTSHSFLGKVLGRSSELGMIPYTDLWNEKGERMSVILDKMIENDNTFQPAIKYAAKKVIKQLASLAKSFAINPNHENAADSVKNIITQYAIDTDLSTDKYETDVDYTPQIIDKVLDLLHASLPGNSGFRELEGMRDHDDTLWYAATNSNVKWPKYDVVLADEVQDFNRCQSIMLQGLSKAGARIVAVGDPNQAIYMFRGADAHAFEAVQSTLDQSPKGNAPHELPVNYRSGRKIIEYVNNNTRVTNLVAGKDFDGAVVEGTPYDQAMDDVAQEKAKTGKLKEQTAFIARTNSPLVKSALNLMRNNVDFVMLGRDFSRELIDHVERVTGKGRFAKTIPIDRFSEEMGMHMGYLTKKWAGKISKENELKELNAVTEAMENVLSFLASNNYEDRNIGMRVSDSRNLVEYLRKRFSGVNLDDVAEAQKFKDRDPLSFVTLTSAHRSKGLEFDRVFIVEPQLFPHPRSKTPEALLQEDNAKYVAFTRAMKELHVLAPMPTDNKSKEGSTNERLLKTAVSYWILGGSN